jgi:hypothetical protein
MQQENQIRCPKCDNPIDVNAVLAKQLEDQITKKLNQSIQLEREALRKKEDELEKLKIQEEDRIKSAVKSRLEKEKIILKNEIQEEQNAKIEKMRGELNEKSKKLRAMYELEAKLESKERELSEQESKIRAEEEKKLSIKLQEEKQHIKNKLELESSLIINELKKKLEDQINLTEEMRRKQTLGSQQAQGESQELLIEEYLIENFPLDQIQEIRKGVRGADVLHDIFNTSGHSAGKILFESKRAEKWKNEWVKKLKENMKEANADVGVLITSVFPKGIDHLTMIEGIWVCSVTEFKGICFLLRDAIIKHNSWKISQENKGDKITKLYDYLTGNDFRETVTAIVGVFSQMQQDLLKERTTITASWEKRQAQIEKVIFNTSSMYGTIQGISNQAIEQIEALEMSNEVLIEHQNKMMVE